MRWWYTMCRYTHRALDRASTAEILLLGTLNAALLALFVFCLRVLEATAEERRAAKR